MNTKLRVLMISGDPMVLEGGSAVSGRLSVYGKFCEHLDVLVCTRTAVGERSLGNLHMHGVVCTSILGFYRAIIVGEGMPKPDLVTAQDPFFLGTVGLFIARHHRIPLEIQIHTDLYDPEFIRFNIRNRFRSFLARFIIARAGQVRVVSNRIKKNLSEQKFAEGIHISVVPVPVTLTSLPTMSKRGVGECLRVLTVSRLTAEKDLFLALDAFALLHKERPESTFVIVGDGPLRYSLETYAERCGISSFVIFVGAQKDVTPYYHDANVYLSTARYEGYGLSLVEAALFGLPIVSTDVGVARELGPSALVPRDAQKIAQALTAPFSSPHVPHSLVCTVEESARQIAENWSTLPPPPTTPRARTPLWFLVKYVASGGMATAVNLSFLYILTEFFSIWYVFSAGLAYAAAFIVSFTLQKFWTFHNGTLTRVRSQFALYVTLGTFNVFLNTSLIYLIVESTGVHYLVAQIGIGLLIALWSLFFYRILFANP